MKTIREKELETELETVEKAYLDLKDRYDQLCSKIKNNANDKRNEGEDFLRNYARNWK